MQYSEKIRNLQTHVFPGHQKLIILKDILNQKEKPQKICYLCSRVYIKIYYEGICRKNAGFEQHLIL